MHGSAEEPAWRRLVPWRELLLAISSGLAFLVLIELGGQVYASFHPAYEVLYLEPNRDVGWTEVPGLRWPWAGFYWYANEYSLEIQTNDLGFHDANRGVPKGEDLVRAVVLGDSYVEALQVPFEKTATRQLENRLNRRRDHAYEVLNFGISGYGLGQELLAFEHYAKRFSPDVAFVFCGTYHMWRTIDSKAGGGFPGTKENHLWIRPTFHLDKTGTLVLDPPRDYEAFREKQQYVMTTYFGGGRWARRPRQLFLKSYLEESWDRGGHLLGAAFRGDAKRPVLHVFRDPSPEVLALNLTILAELVRQAKEIDCRVVLVDVSRFFNATTTLPRALQRFCASHGAAYIPLGDDLLAAERRGAKVQLPLDTHFTELGNELTADALYRGGFPEEVRTAANR